MLKSDSFDMHFTFRIVKNGNVMGFSTRFIRQEVPHDIVVNFNIADSNCVLLLLMTANFLEQLIDSPWDYATVFEIGIRAVH